MKLKRFRITVFLAVLLLVSVGVFYFQIYEADIAEIGSASEYDLIDLDDFAQFRDIFANDSGYVRLISILSPV